MGCGCLLADLARRSALISWNPTVGRDPLYDHGAFMGEKLHVFQQLVDWLIRGIGSQ